jgi:hypothetical protein
VGAGGGGKLVYVYIEGSQLHSGRCILLAKARGRFTWAAWMGKRLGLHAGAFFSWYTIRDRGRSTKRHITLRTNLLGPQKLDFGRNN